MLWAYSEYPIMKDGAPILTSGEVAIKMTIPPRLHTTLFENYRIPSISSHPLEHAKWEIASDVSDDLKRFVRGKYWPKIETKLLADFLRGKGMTASADSYDALGSNQK